MSLLYSLIFSSIFCLARVFEILQNLICLSLTWEPMWRSLWQHLFLFLCLKCLCPFFPGHSLSLCRGRTSKESCTTNIAVSGSWGGLPPRDSWLHGHQWNVMSPSGALTNQIPCVLTCCCTCGVLPVNSSSICAFVYSCSIFICHFFYKCFSHCWWFLADFSETSHLSSLYSCSSLGWEEVFFCIKDVGKLYV